MNTCMTIADESQSKQLRSSPRKIVVVVVIVVVVAVLSSSELLGARWVNKLPSFTIFFSFFFFLPFFPTFYTIYFSRRY